MRAYIQRLRNAWSGNVLVPLRRLKSEDIKNPPSDFRYNYIALYSVPGLNFSPDTKTTIDFSAHAPAGCEVQLVSNLDEVHPEYFRSGAILRLTGNAWVGTTRYKFLARWEFIFRKWVNGQSWVLNKNLEREAEILKEVKRKTVSTSRCFIVISYSAPVIGDADFSQSWGYGDFGVAFNPLKDKQSVGKRQADGFAIAVSVALAQSNGHPELRFVGGSSYLTRNDGLVLYCRTSKVYPPVVFTGTLIDTEFCEKTAKNMEVIQKESRLQGIASLSVLSFEDARNNLRSFVPSWASFEMLINYLEKKNRAVWQQMINDDASELPNYTTTKDEFKALPVEDYTLADRFYVAVCTLNPESPDDDIATFTEAYRMRNKYYHEFQGEAEDLPTRESRRLFTRYLALYIEQLQNSNVT